MKAMEQEYGEAKSMWTVFFFSPHENGYTSNAPSEHPSTGTIQAEQEKVTQRSLVILLRFLLCCRSELISQVVAFR